MKREGAVHATRAENLGYAEHPPEVPPSRQASPAVDGGRHHHQEGPP